MEGLLPKHHSADAVEIPGARSLLEHLIARSTPWTIVTSGTIPLVTGVCNHSLPLTRTKQLTHPTNSGSTSSPFLLQTTVRQKSRPFDPPFS